MPSGLTHFSAISPKFDVATGAAGAATLNNQTGLVTSEALTTATNGTYVLTLTNSRISASSALLVSVGFGTATAGTPVLQSIVPASGSAVITVQNIGPALNGSLKVAFWVLNPQNT